MNTRSTLSTAWLAFALALPAAASAQFVVTNQTGSSSVGGAPNELASGTLVSGGTAAGFYGSVFARIVLGFGVSESSVVAADQLSLSAKLYNSPQAVLNAPAPFYGIPSGTVQGSVSFALAQDTTVQATDWDFSPTTDHVSLFRLLGNGQQQAIALPTLAYDAGGSRISTQYLGSGLLNLAAGDYLLNVAVSGAGSTSGNAENRAGLTITAVPEPATWATFGLGLMGLMAVRRRRQG